jgi:hypothetical protein
VLTRLRAQRRRRRRDRARRFQTRAIIAVDGAGPAGRRLSRMKKLFCFQENNDAAAHPLVRVDLFKQMFYTSV